MKDLFSTNSRNYAQYRPVYSAEMYEFLFARVERFGAAVDVGTGNGQVARVLAKKFKHVYAADISVQQLREAPVLPNLDYIHAPADQLPVPADEADLITVGQAIHWFEIQKFEQEAWRILRPGGLLSYWGYGLGELSNSMWNKAFHQFYQQSLPFWQPEREIVDDHYRTIHMKKFNMNFRYFRLQLEWDSDHLLNYIKTWSAFPDMRDKMGHEILEPLLKLEPAAFVISYPVFLYYGRKP